MIENKSDNIYMILRTGIWTLSRTKELTVVYNRLIF